MGELNAELRGVFQVVTDSGDCVVVTIDRGRVMKVAENQPVLDLGESDAQISEAVAASLSGFYCFLVNPSQIRVSEIPGG